MEVKENLLGFTIRFVLLNSKLQELLINSIAFKKKHEFFSFIFFNFFKRIVKRKLLF